VADTLQASTPLVYDAGLVRLTELGKHHVYLRKNHQPVDSVVRSTIDLRQKLEALAVTTNVVEQNVIKGYLQETYGLLSVYTDPLLRPLLPPIPASGSLVQNFVLGLNGGVLAIDGKALVLKTALVAQTGPPVFNTQLVPGQTVGAVTYNGDVGDIFEFNMPMNTTNAGPQQMFLFIDGVQVGRVDFPMGGMGNAFRLRRQGLSYLDVFQAVNKTSHVDLQPETV
jgi:hypothetical protein